MAKKNYIFYQKTNPFPGWIRFVDQVDIAQEGDGSTKKERYIVLLSKYPDSAIKQFPLGDLPDPEAVKYDEVTETLIPLDVGDITPKVKEETKIKVAKDTLKNTQISSITNVPGLREAVRLLLDIQGIEYKT